MELQQVASRPSVSYVLAAWACAGYAQQKKKRTNHRIRTVHVYAFLRHLAGSSRVINHPSTITLSRACGLSLNTFKTWASKLHQQGWIQWEGGTIQVKSEHEVYALLGLPYGRGGDLRFYFYGDITKVKQPYYWIFLANVEDNQRRQAYSFVQKVKKSEVAMQWLVQYLKEKGHYGSIIERDPKFIASLFHTKYMALLQGERKNELLAFLNENRPDVNRSTRGTARQHNTSASTISRIKEKLTEQGLAAVQKIKTVASPACNHNRGAHVRYNKEQKLTFQAFCDDIVPLKPSERYLDEEDFKPP